MSTNDTDSAAYAANFFGDAAGMSSTLTSTSSAVIFRNGRVIRVGPGTAFGINIFGDVIAFTASSKTTLYTRHGSSVIGTIGPKGCTACYSIGLAMNDFDTVVGYSGYQLSNSTAYVTHAFAYYRGTAHDLGVPAGLDFNSTSSNATAINDFGEIVGTYYATATNYGAFVYENGQIHDLLDLFPESSGWSQVGANGLNNCGDIVGTGTYNGTYRGFVLYPARQANWRSRATYGCI